MIVAGPEVPNSRILLFGFWGEKKKLTASSPEGFLTDVSKEFFFSEAPRGAPLLFCNLCLEHFFGTGQQQCRELRVTR